MLTQKFQVVSGTFGGAPISDGKLRGDTLEFSVGNARYTGKVTGNVIQGIAAAGGNWRATRSSS